MDNQKRELEIIFSFMTTILLVEFKSIMNVFFWFNAAREKGPMAKF